MKVTVVLFGLIGVACGGQALGGADGALDEQANPNQQWIAVPVHPPVDDGFRPVSIKVPPPSSHSSSSGSSGTSGSSSSSSSSSSGGGGGDFSTDLDIPELAMICAERDAPKGTHEFVPQYSHVAPGSPVTVTRDLTEHRYGDGLYRSGFSLVFQNARDRYEDPQHGRTRRETFTSVNVHRISELSKPDVFTVGKPDDVDIGWGTGGDYTCSRDGTHHENIEGESLPYAKAVVTLSKRDASGIAGTIVIGAQTLTFDAPYGEAFPGEDGLCCLAGP